MSKKRPIQKKEEIKKIHLNRFSIHGYKGSKYTATAAFSMEGMDFTIELPDEISEAILAVSRSYIQKQSREAISRLTIALGDGDALGVSGDQDGM